jgi:hypothetical protein
MLIRVSQRTEDDCTVAVVATVMGPSYTYERVLADRCHYRLFNKDGSFSAWWETYLWESGYPNDYRPVAQLRQLVRSGTVIGILMLAPQVTGHHGHVVAVDEYGFINPSTGWPDRIGSQNELIQECRRLGHDYRPERDFLAVDVARASV